MNKEDLVNKLVEEFQVFSSYTLSTKFVVNEIGHLNSFSVNWALIDLIDYTLLNGVHHSIPLVYRRYTSRDMHKTFKLLEERYNG